MRFLPAVAALADGPVRFDGDDSALARPMGPVLTALRTLGVRVEEHGEPGHLPFTVHGRGSLLGGQVDVDASASSQFVSGLLLAAARFERGLTLRHTGRTLPSLPHIEMTVALLREAGRGGRRLAPRDLAGGARSDRRPRRARGARPVQRGAVPVRGAGGRRHRARPGLARRTRRSPAACCPGSSSAWAPPRGWTATC